MNRYNELMSRRSEIMKKALGLDYDAFEREGIAFDYEAMMADAGYSLDEVIRIQQETGVGNTPLLELKNLSRLARSTAPAGKGARILIKDEAANPSGSFKARRAALSVYHAKKLGYKTVIAATSGNYGAAVASQAAMRGLDCIIVQECYDSKHRGQPEIIEKARKCEAYGAEVVQLTVGPELFFVFLELIEETGAFNASLYTPFGIAGVESLGFELSSQVRELFGRDPDAVVATNAGGGNLTGTARGLQKAGVSNCMVVGASVNLQGLHMASDRDFNRKSFTTGHTGFGVPFSTWPDRSDVPRSAARPLRYMDRYLTVTQGEVFWATEALARLEGLERGPAGNTSLAAAFGLAQEMDEDQIIVVQETEYTGAGKHVGPQLSFARENGIDIRLGRPEEEIPGTSIILPDSPELVKPVDLNLSRLKTSLIKKAVADVDTSSLSETEIQFLMDETRSDRDFVMNVLAE